MFSIEILLLAESGHFTKVFLDKDERQKISKNVIYRAWGKRGVLTSFPTF